VIVGVKERLEEVSRLSENIDAENAAAAAVGVDAAGDTGVVGNDEPEGYADVDVLPRQPLLTPPPYS
jgi:hypothetical protein